MGDLLKLRTRILERLEDEKLVLKKEEVGRVFETSRVCVRIAKKPVLDGKNVVWEIFKESEMVYDIISFYCHSRRKLQNEYSVLDSQMDQLNESLCKIDLYFQKQDSKDFLMNQRKILSTMEDFFSQISTISSYDFLIWINKLIRDSPVKSLNRHPKFAKNLDPDIADSIRHMKTYHEMTVYLSKEEDMFSQAVAIIKDQKTLKLVTNIKRHVFHIESLFKNEDLVLNQWMNKYIKMANDILSFI